MSGCLVRCCVALAVLVPFGGGARRWSSAMRSGLGNRILDGLSRGGARRLPGGALRRAKDGGAVKCATHVERRVLAARRQAFPFALRLGILILRHRSSCLSSVRKNWAAARRHGAMTRLVQPSVTSRGARLNRTRCIDWREPRSHGSRLISAASRPF